MDNQYKTAYTFETDIDKAVSDLKRKLAASDAALILFFASSNYDAAKLSTTFAASFAGVTTVGCTTSGEIITGKMLDNSIVAICFSNAILADVKVEVVQDVTKNPHAVKEAFKGFESHFNVSMQEMDHNRFIGIVLTDGLSGTEEVVMDKIGDLTNITFIGGSTGDDLKFKETHVFYNGKSYTNASLLLLMKPSVAFSILKTQSFTSTGRKLVVTKVVEEERKVIEFNNKPATVAYAEALGVSVDELSKVMFYNPLGLMADDEPFVRSPRLIEGTSMYFYCSVKEGMELDLLNSTDIIQDTADALLKKKEETGDISALINFNCILRTLDLKQQNRTKEYGDLFKDFPTIGFSTYGESLIGHMNQTATMLVFSKS